MKKIFLILVISITLYAQLTYIGNGVISDSKSGLYWQDEYGKKGTPIKQAKWKDALIYCHELTLGNYSDWRLPNIVELKSIIDRSRSNPAIYSTFANTNTNYFWSSTTSISDTSGAWGVSFYDGYDNWNSKEYENSIRCVRSDVD